MTGYRDCMAGGIWPLLVLLGGLSVASAQEQPPRTRCDAQLGHNYDRLAPEQKDARLDRYLSCRFNLSYTRLEVGKRRILTDVDNWKRRAENVVHRSLSNQFRVATGELKAMHQNERVEHKTKYERLHNDLDARATPDNRDEIAAERRRLNAEARAARKAMEDTQAEERRGVRERFRQCRESVASELSRLWGDEVQDINNQFIRKSSRLEQRYTLLKDTPMEQSPNDYLQSQSGGGASSALLADVAAGAVTGGGAGGAAAGGSCRIVFGTPAEGQDDAESSAGRGQQIGSLTRIDGTATINGAPATPGTAVHLGDTIAAGDDGGLVISFADGSELSMPGGTLMLDRRIYDPDEVRSGSEFWSLSGLFKYISHLISRPVTDVEVDGPVGSLGIRG